MVVAVAIVAAVRLDHPELLQELEQGEADRYTVHRIRDLRSTSKTWHLSLQLRSKVLRIKYVGHTATYQISTK